MNLSNLINEKPVDDCPLPSYSVHVKLPAVLIQVEIISQL